MRAEELIDDGLTWGDNISPTDAAYVERRRRAAVFLRDVFDDVYTARPWPRRRTVAQLTMAPNTGTIAAPWDYGRIGPYGGLYLVVGGIVMRDALDYVPEHEIIQLRSLQSRIEQPDRFAIFDVQAVGSDSFRDVIQLPITPTQIYFEFHYLRKTPRLLDAGDPDLWLTQAVDLARSGTTITGTVAQAHRLQTDDYVVIAGATNPGYNGSWRVVVTGELTFTYELTTGSGSTPDAGTWRRDVQLADAATSHIPEEFHNCVIAKGLRSKLLWSKGDARWVGLDAEYREGLDGIKKERGRYESSMRRMPSFFGGR